MTPELIGITFAPEGVQLTYSRLPDDLKKNGLVWQHNVFVPNRSDYDDELQVLVDATNALLLDVLDDEETAEHIEPPKEKDEDDD